MGPLFRQAQVTSPSRMMHHHTKKTSTVTYVVPLSVTGTILLVASVVGWHNRKKLVSERLLQSQEFKNFKSQFTDNLGRLRGLSIWATQFISGGS